MYTFPSILILLFCATVQIASAWKGQKAEENGPSSSQLIEVGRYQRAADKILQKLNAARADGLEGEQAALLSNLGMAYDKLGQYSEAESSLKKARQIWRSLGETGGETYGRTVNNLGTVYLDERRYAKAEELFQEALDIGRAAENPNLTDIALCISNLGLTRLGQGRFQQAEQLFRESLELQRRTTDSTHLAVTVNNLALTYKMQARLEEAALLYAQAVELWRINSGNDGSDVAIGLHNLAMAEGALGKFEDAQKHFKEALATVDRALPPQHPTRTAILMGYAELLRKAGHKHEAKQFQSLARALMTQHAHENFEDLTVDVKEFVR